MKSLYQNKTVLKIAKKASLELNIPIHLIVEAYRAFFDNIKAGMAEHDFLDESIDYSEFTKSFNLQGIGKIYTNGEIIKKVKVKVIKSINRRNEENKSN